MSDTIRVESEEPEFVKIDDDELPPTPTPSSIFIGQAINGCLIPFQYELWRDGIYKRDFEKAPEIYTEGRTAPIPSHTKDVPQDHKCVLQLVAHRPVWVTNTGKKADTDDATELVELTFTYRYVSPTQDQYEHLWIELSQIADSKRLIELAGFRVPVNTSNVVELLKYLNSCYETNFRQINPKSVAWRTGYYDVAGQPAWLIGNYWIGPKDTIIDHKQRTAVMQAIACRGSLDVWTKYTHDLMKRFPVTRWFMACSFAAPLLRLVGERTFVVHHYGDSRNSKSALALLAQSAWSHPEESKQTFNSTDLAMTEVFRYVSDIPVLYDELQSAKNKEKLGTVIYAWTNERHRQRVRREGGLQKTSGAWRTIIRTTGEESLISRTGDIGGQSTRVLEVHDVGLPEADGRKIYGFLGKGHYGFAGIKFLQTVSEKIRIDGLESIRESVARLRAEVVTGDGLHDPFIDRLSVIAYAEMLMLIILYGYSKSEAREMAIESAHTMLLNVTGRMETKDRLWKRVLGKLIEHRNSTPQVYADLMTGEGVQRALEGPRGAAQSIVAYDRDDELWYNPSAINPIIQAAFGGNADPERIWGDLAREGIICKGKDRIVVQRSCAEAKIRGSWFYVLKKERFELPDETFNVEVTAEMLVGFEDWMKSRGTEN